MKSFLYSFENVGRMWYNTYKFFIKEKTEIIMEEKITRSKKDYAKRYALFSAGLTVTALGIALITKMNLGTSPLSAIPYSLSMIVPTVSLGNWTIIFSLLLIIIQLVLLKKNANIFELLLQLVLSFPFGYLIDGFMLLFKNLSPQLYAVRIVCVVIGCTVIALGVYIQVLADVVMLPGDAFVRAIAKVSKKEFGTVRVISDITMVTISALLCIIFLNNISGAREGTIISAFITGNIVKVYGRLFKKITG